LRIVISHVNLLTSRRQPPPHPSIDAPQSQREPSSSITTMVTMVTTVSFSHLCLASLPTNCIGRKGAVCQCVPYINTRLYDSDSRVTRTDLMLLFDAYTTPTPTTITSSSTIRRQSLPPLFFFFLLPVQQQQSFKRVSTCCCCCYCARVNISSSSSSSEAIKIRPDSICFVSTRLA